MCTRAVHLYQNQSPRVTPDPGFKVTVGKIGDFRPLAANISKTVEARIMQFSTYTVAPSLQFLQGKFHPDILRGCLRAVASNKGGWVKSAVFYLQA